jgi:outer membrane biosynthesis protein TonB
LDRAEGTGLGVAIAGHVALFVLLSVGLFASKPLPAIRDVMDVQLTDAVGLQSASPEPAIEAPAPSEAPVEGPPEDAAPPVAKVEPAPEPTPPKPVAKPTPAPVPTPKPAPKAETKPAPPKPEAKKAAPAKSRLSPDLLKDIKDAEKAGQGSNAAAKTDKATGSRLGKDFLKGIGVAQGKGKTARAAITGAAMNGLAAAIKRQIQPCYELGSLAGTSAMQIVTVLNLRFNADGSVSGQPQLVEQTGVNGTNQQYARQMADVGRRAVQRCSPLKLPAELYEGGWEDFNFRFKPGELQL